MVSTPQKAVFTRDVTHEDLWNHSLIWMNIYFRRVVRDSHAKAAVDIFKRGEIKSCTWKRTHVFEGMGRTLRTWAGLWKFSHIALIKILLHVSQGIPIDDKTRGMQIQFPCSDQCCTKRSNFKIELHAMCNALTGTFRENWVAPPTVQKNIPMALSCAVGKRQV